MGVSRIKKYFKSENRKISHDTILNYLKFCSDAFLFYKINRYDLEGKKIVTVNEKYYCADHGLREALLGKNIQNIDQVLENIVCLELLRRNYKVYVGKKGDLVKCTPKVGQIKFNFRRCIFYV